MKVPNRTKSIAKSVRELLLRRPFLINAIKLGVVNYSALARMLEKELGASSEAIKAAILRERTRLIASLETIEKEVLALLKKSKISMRDKVAIIISKEELRMPCLAKVHLSDSFVYLVDQMSIKLDEAKGATILKDMTALTIESPIEVEKTPGFIAFITQLLVGRGINIQELISCYKDTILVLRPEDAIQAFILLREFM